MKKNLKILFFGRKNCNFSKKILFEIKKLSNNIKVILSIKQGEKLTKNVLNWRGDYIFCFRSFFILPSKLINNASIAAINFHPGPPEYRGIGCVNFAIFNNEKKYGATCHLISKKIDSGKIIDVKRFNIKAKDSIDTLLKKTYKIQIIQFKKIIKKIKNRSDFKQILNKEKWSKRLYTKKNLNDLYLFNKTFNIREKNLKKYLRSTMTKNFSPYLKIKEKKFLILDNKI